MHFPPPSDREPVPRAQQQQQPKPQQQLGRPPYVRPPQVDARPRSRRVFHARLAVAGGIVVVLGATAAFAKGRYLPSADVLPGIAIDGERLPDGADAAAVRAVAAAHARALLGRRIALANEGQDRPVLEASLEELGLRVDVDRVVAIALGLGKDGDVLGRAAVATDARDGRIDVPLLTRVEREIAWSRLEKLKETEDSSPVSARLDLDKHETIPERDGRYIDADETIAALEIAARQHPVPAVVRLPVRSFPPRISSAFLKSLDISSVLAEYETYFSRGGDQQKRGKNIDNAAQKLDGVVISPGELVSFNEIIGERSEANGFEKSWEIFKGEMVEGVGGGTCQVASTFHAATFFGGFDVLERLPHSRPSAYIPMGLDSTVVFPAVDLKVRNPHPFPVVVHAKTVGGKLRVELLGRSRPVRVGFEREVVSTLPYKRKIEEDPTLSGKKVLVKQHGIKGFKIKRIRTLTYADGARKKEELTDTYPPTTEIYKVPVGFDVALLPPLPEGDGEDADLGGNPSATPPSAREPAAPGTDPSAANAITPASAEGIEFVEAPGAHAPTAQQRDPAKTLHLRR
jgi:vancomycin resistance protein YoaR